LVRSPELAELCCAKLCRESITGISVEDSGVASHLEFDASNLTMAGMFIAPGFYANSVERVTLYREHQ
jgi:hypothetical protein